MSADSAMVMRPVDSSFIKEVGYDAGGRRMTVVMHSGAKYHFEGVSFEKHDAFMRAESPGQHFSQHIRGQHDFSRIG